MEEFNHYLPLEFTLILQLLKSWESFKFVHDTLYFRVQGFQKYVFLIFEFSPTFFGRTEILIWKNIFKKKN